MRERQLLGFLQDRIGVGALGVQGWGGGVAYIHIYIYI